MKRVIVFLLACFLILSSVSVSFAAAPVLSATRWCSPSSGFGGGSRVIPTDTVISYSDLCDYRSSANRWLGSGMYPGFHGYATIVYTGSFYYIQLIQDSDTYWLCNSSGGRYRTQAEYKSDDTPTTVPSTTPPSIDNHESTESDNTYISDPSSPSDSTTELNALNRLIKFTFSQIKAIHGLWRTNIKMYNIQIKLRSLMWNMIDGINNITKGIYKQVDLFDAYLPRLDDIYNRLSNIEAASWSSVDVQGRILSNVSGIAFHLDSVISNGVVQVGSASLEARLDKLISMYSKVNSVVLDTAAINGGQIKAAVGGELEDVMFWGLSGKASNRFEVSPLQYTLNGAVEKVSDIVLRGFSLGTSIPDTINADDALLLAGVWQTGGNTFRISDTYNAATGEYVQRIKSFTLDGSERWQMYDKGNGVFLFRCVNLPLDDLPESRFGMSSANGWTSSPWRAAAFAAAANDAAANYVNQFCIYRSYVGFLSKRYSSLDAWKKYLGDLSAAGTPMEIWYVPRSGAVSTTLDRSTIAIPEGDSTITCDRVRITGKYETYDSYTQTADIIAAINGIPVFDDSAVVDAIANLENALSKPSATVTADLTEVTTRLDALIENSASKVENVTVNITEDNDAFNVFYITGDDGETQPITEFAKDLSGASGKFLSVLYRLVFSDALDSAGSDLGNLEDFFTSTEPVEDTATQSADSAHEEVDIWSAF